LIKVGFGEELRVVVDETVAALRVELGEAVTDEEFIVEDIVLHRGKKQLQGTIPEMQQRGNKGPMERCKLALLPRFCDSKRGQVVLLASDSKALESRYS
jgi:hypothetical protein